MPRPAALPPRERHRAPRHHCRHCSGLRQRPPGPQPPSGRAVVAPARQRTAAERVNAEGPGGGRSTILLPRRGFESRHNRKAAFSLFRFAYRCHQCTGWNAAKEKWWPAPRSHRKPYRARALGSNLSARFSCVGTAEPWPSRQAFEGVHSQPSRCKRVGVRGHSNDRFRICLEPPRGAASNPHRVRRLNLGTSRRNDAAAAYRPSVHHFSKA